MTRTDQPLPAASSQACARWPRPPRWSGCSKKEDDATTTPAATTTTTHAAPMAASAVAKRRADR